MKTRIVAVVAVIAGAIGAAVAQTTPSEQVTVPFSDPSRPGRLRVGLTQGSIKVTGSSRRDVLIAARPRGAGSRGGSAEGLRRLPQSPAFSVQEDANEMSVQSDSPNSAFDFEIQAPTRTHL
jgi:hypothetical protein